MVAGTDPTIRVNELTLGSGGLCGSVYLNKRFEEIVRNRIGKQIDSLSKSESLEAMDEVPFYVPANWGHRLDHILTLAPKDPACLQRRSVYLIPTPFATSCTWGHS